jgi:hypothetical protein
MKQITTVLLLREDLNNTIEKEFLKTNNYFHLNPITLTHSNLYSFSQFGSFFYSLAE